MNAIWDSLPFSGTAVHALASGDMFRMLEPVPCGDIKLELCELFRSPGQIVYYPPINEIAFCVGKAQLAATQGDYWCMPLGELDGDWRAWGEYGNTLSSLGAKPVSFRVAADQTSPFTVVQTESGKDIEVVVDGVAVAHGHLLEETSPGASAELLKRLPFVGVATNAPWAGPMTEVRAADGSDVDLSDLRDGSTVFHWAGYIYYSLMRNLLLISYGSAQEGAAGYASELIPWAAPRTRERPNA